MNKFKKCKYFDSEGLLTCNTELYNCSECPLKKSNMIKDTTKWIIGVSGIIIIFGIIFYFIQMMIEGAVF